MDINQKIEKSRFLYNDVRIFGVDLLKFFLSVVIVSIVIPIYFHNTLTDQLGHLMVFLYLAWMFGLMSVIFALLAYVFVFEGFLYQAHYISSGMFPDLLTRQDIPDTAKEYIKKQIDQIPKTIKLSEGFFNWSHWFGITCVCTFLLSMLLIIAPIAIKTYFIFCN